MTPLAARILKHPQLRLDEADAPDRDWIWGNLRNAHCFEVTEVSSLVDDVIGCWRRLHPSGLGEGLTAASKELVFLPAPQTWIEYEYKNDRGASTRIAFFLIDNGQGVAIIYMASASNGVVFGLSRLGAISLETTEMVAARQDHAMDPKFGSCFAAIRAFLVVINSPRIISRIQHEPNTGLRRNVARSIGKTGKYPLPKWTEIKLQVTKPREIDDGEEHEHQITGRRALHFCRKHIRIKNGKLEYVTSHWRGDPAVGIRQGRYTVTA